MLNIHRSSPFMVMEGKRQESITSQKGQIWAQLLGLATPASTSKYQIRVMNGLDIRRASYLLLVVIESSITVIHFPPTIITSLFDPSLPLLFMGIGDRRTDRQDVLDWMITLTFDPCACL